MTDVPAVSVIVPTYNRAIYLGECLDSLLAQTLPIHQVLVAVDGSTDDTDEVLRRFEGRVEVLHTEHTGKPETVNRAMTRVTGEYVWIFDDDDVALPDAVERFVAPLERHPEHAFSYSNYVLTVNAPGSHRLGRTIWELETPDLEPRGFLVNLLELDFVGGAALFVRKSCYDRVGPFDTRLLRSQDYEMAVRIARRHTGVRVEGGPTFHLRQHAGLRGPRGDRFQPSKRYRKWLEHDQIFFRDLHREIPLEEYLPPGTPLDGNRRRAVLQRMAVMASKLLSSEAAADVRVLADLGDDAPFTDPEIEIVHGALTHVPYYQQGWILDDPEFTGTMEELARTSTAVKQLLTEVESAKDGPAGREKRLRERLAMFLRERETRMGADSQRGHRTGPREG